MHTIYNIVIPCYSIYPPSPPASLPRGNCSWCHVSPSRISSTCVQKYTNDNRFHMLARFYSYFWPHGSWDFTSSPRDRISALGTDSGEPWPLGCQGLSWRSSYSSAANIYLILLQAAYYSSVCMCHNLCHLLMAV